VQVWIFGGSTRSGLKNPSEPGKPSPSCGSRFLDIAVEANSNTIDAHVSNIENGLFILQLPMCFRDVPISSGNKIMDFGIRCYAFLGHRDIVHVDLDDREI